ncbi:MAG: hypothetical protein ACK5IB_03930 [Qingshengfaniella sp.]
MSTRTCKTSGIVGALALTVVLAGCSDGPGLAGQSYGMRGPVQALRVSERDVTIVGPSGYCIDGKTVQDRSSGAFVMLGNCATLRDEGNAPDTPGVLTALISPRTDQPMRPGPERLLSFFRSSQGRAALAYDGVPDPISIMSSAIEGDVLYLRVRDRSVARPEDLSDLSWRAVLSLKDRIVALSVTGHRTLPISNDEARATLRAFVAAMTAANQPVLADAPVAEDKT